MPWAGRPGKRPRRGLRWELEKDRDAEMAPGQRDENGEGQAHLDQKQPRGRWPVCIGAASGVRGGVSPATCARSCYNLPGARQAATPHSGARASNPQK